MNNRLYGAFGASLSNLFIAIFMTESKELKLILHLVIGAM